MNKKKYIIVAVVILLVVLGWFLTIQQNQKKEAKQSTKTNHTYTVVNKAFSPKSSHALTHGEIFQEKQANDPAQQRFVIKSAVDGSTRELFHITNQNLKFEKITPQNWSPTNRFVFIYVDYPDRRDVVFVKTDGKFTNGKYFLHSTALYPDMNVTNAKWINSTMLELQTTNIKTNTPQKYLVNFDDDSGVVTPEK